MTREKFWEIVQILVQKDYWDAQSVPPKEIKEILTKSILIPKPKFKVGDVVKTDNGAVFTIDLFENLDLEDGWIYQFYDPNDNKWRYLAFEDYEWSFHEEDWLELVEEGR